MDMLYKRGNVYRVKYSVNGRPIQESTSTDKMLETKKVLKEQ